MTVHAAHDVAVNRASLLRPLEPDSARARRVRARCRAQLARNRMRSERMRAAAGIARRIVAPVVAAGLCALYFADLLGMVLRAFTK